MAEFYNSKTTFAHYHITWLVGVPHFRSKIVMIPGNVYKSTLLDRCFFIRNNKIREEFGCTFIVICFGCYTSI